MNAQTQDLEQIAREALGSVPTSGVDRLSERSREGLKYGLQHSLFEQADVDAAQVKFREYNAREALGLVPTRGVDGFLSREGLKYGLQHRLFTQAEVDAAEVKFRDLTEYTTFREHTAREALGSVPIRGVDGLSERSREGLQYGLQHGLFTQADVDAAQKRYKKRQSFSYSIRRYFYKRY